MKNNVIDKMKQRSNQFFIVLNDSSADLFKNSNYLFREFKKRIDDVGFLALIKHENEYDEEEKRVKTPHYHLCFNLKYNKVCSLNNMLNMIVNAFHCNANQVSIEKCSDMCMSVRYLIHMDNVDKQAFPPFEIVSSDDKLVNDFLHRIREINDIKDMIEIAEGLHFDTKGFMLKVGEKNWKKWRVEFLDLKRDLRSYL